MQKKEDLKTLIVLLGAFAISLFIIRIFNESYEFALAARIAMSAMLLFTAIGHFAFTNGMAMMLPSFVSYKTEVVYLTGVIEIAAAIGLFIPSVRIFTAWLLIVFFVFILPANIYAAIKHLDYQKGTFDGSGLTYLWFRVPLQILFIVWVYISFIRY